MVSVACVTPPKTHLMPHAVVNCQQNTDFKYGNLLGIKSPGFLGLFFCVRTATFFSPDQDAAAGGDKGGAA